jgi:polysaccharide biosynthesis protein PslG
VAEGLAIRRVPRRSRARWAAPLAILAVAAALIGTTVTERAEAKPPAEFFGVVIAGQTTPEDFRNMAATGIRTLRLLVFWPSVESSPGSFNWGSYDYFIGQAAQNGIRVFPTLYGTPTWAHTLAGTGDCGSSCAPQGNASRMAFANFARAAAERYGPGGDFWSGDCGLLCEQPPPCACSTPVPVHSWQLWNEQNSAKYFAPRPDPVSYAHLLFETSAAIRAVDPSAEIVLGGMWGPRTTAAVVPAATYLKRLYAVPDVERTFDAIAVHPYSPSLFGVLDQIRTVRRATRRAGDGGVATWVTELGWASGGPRNVGLVKTPRGQGRLLTRSFEALIERRRAWRIRGITWYAWRDATAAETDCTWCPRAGLWTRSGREKPAGRAYRRIAKR